MPDDSPDVRRNSRESRQRGVAAAGVLLVFSALIALANALAAQSRHEESLWMVASGVTMGLIAIPVFAIGLPVYLARRWRLPHSWWPTRDHVLPTVAILVLYVVLTNFSGLRALAAEDFEPARFATHYVSAMLFHIPYYPLFGALVLPAWRNWVGMLPALVLTAAAFSLYHLTQWHFFPAGTQPVWLILLFLAFFANLLLYLYTRSLVLVGLTHSLAGAVGLAGEGTWFDQRDFLFYLTVIILSATVAWSIFDQRHMKRYVPPPSGFWLEVRFR